MNKVFTKNGWDDYIYRQTEDKNTWKKINKLIEDLCRNGNFGLGKPEPLLGDLSGFWSRKINEKAPVNRVFTVSDAFHSMRKKRLELSQD